VDELREKIKKTGNKISLEKNKEIYMKMMKFAPSLDVDFHIWF